MFCYCDYVKVIIECYYWSLDIVTSYDKEKYRDLLLDAAETVLGYFGFDGSVYRRSEQTEEMVERIEREKNKRC